MELNSRFNYRTLFRILFWHKKFLETLGSRIGTGSIFCYSFSFSNNVDRLYLLFLLIFAEAVWKGGHGCCRCSSPPLPYSQWSWDIGEIEKKIHGNGSNTFFLSKGNKKIRVLISHGNWCIKKQKFGSSPNYTALFHISCNVCGMVFCYQNCSDLLWEKFVLVIKKNFWNSRLKAENLTFFWDH